MLYHIFKQIRAQRKYNTWIFIELILVFVLVWYIVDYSFVLVHNRSITKGFDTRNTFMVTYGVLPNTSPRHDPGEADSVAMLASVHRFMDAVRAYPGVEYATFVDLYTGSYPYAGGYSNWGIGRDSTEIYIHTRYIQSGDYFRIFRLTSSRDNSFEKLAQIDLTTGNKLIMTQYAERKLFPDGSAIGQQVKMNDLPYQVAEVANDQKRFDYEQPQAVAFVYKAITYENYHDFAIVIRVKEDIPENLFIEQFQEEMNSKLRIGNLYLYDIESFSQMKKNMEYRFGITNQIRIRTSLMIFLLLNIGLGIIGTFWFRNQARKSEIGLRMALGSNQKKLQSQLVTESILLLTAAMIPALLITFGIVQADLIQTLGVHYTDSGYITANKWLRFLITSGITYVLLIVIVALSAWIPAYQASKVHPVEALRDE